MSSLRWNDSKKRKRDSGKDSGSKGPDEGNESADNSPAGGSIGLDVIKQSDEYSRRIVYDNAPKKKYALALAYLGTAYRGLQINPGIITIECLLEKALFLAGGIEEPNFGDVHKISWSRAGRTDKGVHALANCCSMKLAVPFGQEAQFIENVNSFLPPDIRLLTMTKTMKNFGAKFHCSGRLYQYLLPSYVLSKVEDVNAILSSELQRSSSGMASEYEPHLGNALLSSARDTLLAYRISPEELQRFREVLAHYEGTHNYHNFTSDKSASEASASRYIMRVECSEPFFVPGSQVEWLCISLRGQSFLLNQIRKMIGLAVDVIRGGSSADIFDKCFSRTEKIDILMVPGLGLYLKELFWDRYHAKLDCENEKNDKIRQKLIEKAALPGSTVDVEKELALRGTGTAAADKIEWSSKIPEMIESFEKSTLWLHIQQQEESSLAFMSYLDHLRLQSLRTSGHKIARASATAAGAAEEEEEEC